MKEINTEAFMEQAMRARTLEILQELRERADAVEAMDGMYGKINAANQIRHEIDRIAEKYNLETYVRSS